MTLTPAGTSGLPVKDGFKIALTEGKEIDSLNSGGMPDKLFSLSVFTGPDEQVSIIIISFSMIYISRQALFQSVLPHPHICRADTYLSFRADRKWERW